jgi:tetratricopeptide (TPR) repeat protein
LEAYRKALALKSDYEWAWTGVGNSLLALDRVKEAIEAQRQAVKLRRAG